MKGTVRETERTKFEKKEADNCLRFLYGKK